MRGGKARQQDWKPSSGTYTYFVESKKWVGSEGRVGRVEQGAIFRNLAEEARECEGGRDGGRRWGGEEK